MQYWTNGTFHVYANWQGKKYEKYSFYTCTSTNIIKKWVVRTTTDRPNHLHTMRGGTLTHIKYWTSFKLCRFCVGRGEAPYHKKIWAWMPTYICPLLMGGNEAIHMSSCMIISLTVSPLPTNTIFLCCRSSSQGWHPRPHASEWFHLSVIV